jgi:hypothetical protein
MLVLVAAYRGPISAGPQKWQGAVRRTERRHLPRAGRVFAAVEIM